MMEEKKNRGLRKAVIIALWLLIWQLAGLLVDNAILMVGPAETGKAFVGQLGSLKFWQTAGCSLSRIGAGFLAGACLGLVLAAVSARFGLLEEFLSPALSLLKAVPVASFAVLLLIWWGSSFLSVAVSFLIVLPAIYINTLEGLKSMDPKLLEMATVFRVPLWNRFFYIYRPALKPFLDSSLKLAMGMAWKSGVAAEVIGTPDFSIGERLYMSKIYLDTAGVFAWTAAVILLSFFSERLIMVLWESFSAWEPVCRPPVRENIPAGGTAGFLFSHVYKGFEGQQVLRDFSASYGPGAIHYLTWPSGAGKTTALRLLAGLEKPDSGRVEGPGSCNMVFQENRLCEAYSAVRNVELVLGSRTRARLQLSQVLPEDALDKPCGQLSGGQKRRVAVVRALAADSGGLLLDEPFTGLDEESRRRTLAYVIREQKGRTVLMAAHTEKDV